MQRILSLLLIMACSAAMVQAATYSCRDKQGKLFITDNLQALPAECLGQTRVVEPKDPDNLNYVPAQANPQGSGATFRQSVRAVEHEQRQAQGRVEKMLLHAEQLAEQYRQAIQEKNNATRRWSYGSREIIQKADDRIKKAREEKKEILAEMLGQKIPRDDEKKIVSWLDEIVD
ncbi:MAG: DUF4124 domain-containing protein [Thermodesulfobacteriota bacterium]|nr:DUF4124 domain-containing protein [Thermodesulfobacteriota bacterium]